MKLSRLLTLVPLISAVLIAGCSTSNPRPVLVEPLPEPTSYVPDTAEPLPTEELEALTADQLVELSGSFIMNGDELIFQSGGEGSPTVDYFLDHDRWSTVMDFMSYTHSEVPSAMVKGYLLDNGKLAVCRTEELFTFKTLVIDDCPLQ